MSRKKKAAKKALWENLSPGHKFFSFSHGDAYARSPEMWEFAARHALAFDCTKKIPASPEGFDQRIAEWDGPNLIRFMVEITNMALDCYAKKDGKKLHELADAITNSQKNVSKFVDSERNWLLTHLFDLTGNNQPKEPKKTFSEIRDGFFLKFENSSIDDKELRKMVKDLGYQCLPDKRGPKSAK
jgi:hypothetical protein